MDEIVVRCRPKQFEILVIEVGLNILNWVTISDELFVVLKLVSDVVDERLGEAQ